MEEEQQWKLGDGTSAYVSRIGFCKHDAEKNISTLRLTNLITDIERYMTRFMQVTDYSQLSEIQNLTIKLNIGRLEET
jgi:hypothetical protein